MKIHHVGYLVKKIDKAQQAFLDLGYVIVKDKVYDQYRDVTICFMEKDGYVIELVAPETKDSVVYGLMKKMGNTPYHICYESGSFDADVQSLLEKNYVLCSEKCPAPALDNKNVCFLIHPYMGMVELVEE